jgi:hypothetical protein
VFPLKGIKELKALSIMILTFALVITSSCARQEKQQATPVQLTPETDRIFLTVDFHKRKSLRYKFVSRRSITVDWGTSKRGTKTYENIKRSSERAEMVFSYRPVKIDPYGVTMIEAKCESVEVSRSGEGTTSRDALKNLRGKTFTLEIDSTGSIQDYTSLKDLAYKMGEKAFRTSRQQKRRIKDPDMVRDLVATQWFLWDSISSIPNPAEGVDEGQTWQSQLSVPLPMLVKPARDVTYKLSQIREDEKGKFAVIKSTYSLGEPIPKKWPVPYEGNFMMSGQFGFFTNYNVASLEGSGEQLFNIEAGRIERDRQSYSVELEMLFPMPLGKGESAKPKTTVRQTITMGLMKD